MILNSFEGILCQFMNTNVALVVMSLKKCKVLLVKKGQQNVQAVKDRQSEKYQLQVTI